MQYPARLDFTRDLGHFAPPIGNLPPEGVIARKGSVYLLGEHQKM
jgi:hypothetical protein